LLDVGRVIELVRVTASKRNLYAIEKVRYRGAVCAGLLSLLLVLTACSTGGRQEPTATPSSAIDGTISVTLKNSEFQPGLLRFSQGESVKFLLNSADEVHTFSVEGLGLSWVVPRSAQPVVQEFTFDKPGRYELVCVIAGHKADGMVGEIIVE
jgi:plastocyanin